MSPRSCVQCFDNQTHKNIGMLPLACGIVPCSDGHVKFIIVIKNVSGYDRNASSSVSMIQELKFTSRSQTNKLYFFESVNCFYSVSTDNILM
jgi:hypothetical protein